MGVVCGVRRGKGRERRGGVCVDMMVSVGVDDEAIVAERKLRHR